MIKHDLTDTIAAIATAIGQGGIGIVRLSGTEALGIADKLFVCPSGAKPSTFKTYTTHYGSIVDKGKIVDEVILTVMRGPKSYTREDVVEINCHGGIVALRDVLALVLASGCRLAEPGEFTKRAFLNGRIDLVQAEAVLEIIRAKADSALRLGLGQLKGGLSRRINAHRECLLQVLTHLEANIDFPEELSCRPDLKDLSGKMKNTHEGLKEMIKGFPLARVLREGIHVVICGKPNVGKSSLLNTLLKEERSIVTPVAGTTRDTIEEIIDIQGIPVRIVDTAGILEPRGLVEKKAVQRSRRHIAAADLVVLIFDGSKRLSKEDFFLMRRLKNKRVIALVNKIDLKQKIERGKILKNFPHLIDISAKKSRNIGLLEKAILDVVYSGSVISPESGVASNLRQLGLIQKAEKFIAQARKSLDNGLSLEFIAQDMKEALGYLDDLLGKDFSPGLLDRIFSEFCIGK